MPGSSQEGKLFFRDWVSDFLPKKVLDVGAGSGGYGKIIRDLKYECQVDAVEVYADYIQQYKLSEVYDRIFNVNILDFDPDPDNYDLMIFGDVVEHIEKQRAIELLARMRKRASFLWICLPLKVTGRSWSLGYQQGSTEYAANINEKHLYDWTYEEVVSELGPFLWIAPFRVVGVFIAEGDLK